MSITAISKNAREVKSNPTQGATDEWAISSWSKVGSGKLFSMHFGGRLVVTTQELLLLDAEHLALLRSPIARLRIDYISEQQGVWIYAITVKLYSPMI